MDEETISCKFLNKHVTYDSLRKCLNKAGNSDTLVTLTDAKLSIFYTNQIKNAQI